MKKFWLSCGLALVLVALSGLGFIPASGRAESNAEKAPPAEKAPESGSKEKGKGDKAGPDGSLYVHLQPMVLPVVGNNGAEQLVTLMIDLQVADSDVADKIRAKMPRVQDSILRALYGGLGDGSLRKGHVVDISKIKAKIASALDQTMEGHIINDVLIQAVAQRML